MGLNFEKIVMKNDLEKKYFNKIKSYNKTIWDNKASKQKVDKWLGNFDQSERIEALHLLTEFIYFNKKLVDTLLISIYRDLFKYKVIEKIRKDNNNTLDSSFIESEYKKIKKCTRFLSLGEDSESGSHLLYPFRQLNKLKTSNGLNTKDENIENIIFIDDFCGSGHQAIKYSQENIKSLRAKCPKANIFYFMMVGTKQGRANIKEKTQFDDVDFVLELDETYKCFGINSRIFKNIPETIKKGKIEKISRKYGKPLVKSILIRETPDILPWDLKVYAENRMHGYNNGQLLIGFFHNTPDNTLPIFWYNEEMIVWQPIFKRHNKVY